MLRLVFNGAFETIVIFISYKSKVKKKLVPRIFQNKFEILNPGSSTLWVKVLSSVSVALGIELLTKELASRQIFYIKMLYF